MAGHTPALNWDTAPNTYHPEDYAQNQHLNAQKQAAYNDGAALAAKIYGGAAQDGYWKNLEQEAIGKPDTLARSIQKIWELADKVDELACNIDDALFGLKTAPQNPVAETANNFVNPTVQKNVVGALDILRKSVSRLTDIRNQLEVK